MEIQIHQRNKARLFFPASRAGGVPLEERFDHSSSQIDFPDKSFAHFVARMLHLRSSASTAAGVDMIIF